MNDLVILASTFAGSWLGMTLGQAQTIPAKVGNYSKFVYPGPAGKLVYAADPAGDQIPDFSNAGYMGGGVRIPDVPVALELAANPTGDDTRRIQQALDAVSKLPLGSDGFRGSVLLRKGRYRIEKQLAISASGVVLRGEGQDAAGTVLVATGRKARDLIQIHGPSGPLAKEDTAQKITDSRVPVGARSFRVADGTKFAAGQTVIVTRHGNASWIHEIGMDRITPRPGNPGATVQWTPFNLLFDRLITSVADNRLTLDAPLTCAIETRWGGGEICRSDDAGRISKAGVENLRAESEFDPKVTKLRNGREYPADENHAMYLVSFRNVSNAWARDLTALHFYHGLSSCGSGAKWVTIQDSKSVDPVSEITGGRRYAFRLDGQLCLVQRCWSGKARHAFVVDAWICGPNVFLDCRSEQDFATSEPHQRWSVGGLYDNVSAPLAIQDRQYMGSGHGWAGANYVVWNCTGSLVCQQPPTAHNWAIGFVGKKSGGSFDGRCDGYWESTGKPVEPRSLYLRQLEDRLGPSAIKNLTKR